MQTTTKKLVLSALFLAIGLVLPFLTGQIPQFGQMLLPMHLPILLCGLICGWQYGLVTGFVLPLLRSVLFTMPPMFAAIAMAFELAAYGCLCGLLFQRSQKKSIARLYLSLILSMLGGRIVWGAVRSIMSGVAAEAFTWQMFMAGAFLNAIPGILLQLILIPILMSALDKSGLLPFSAPKREKAE